MTLEELLFIVALLLIVFYIAGWLIGHRDGQNEKQEHDTRPMPPTLVRRRRDE